MIGIRGRGLAAGIAGVLAGVTLFSVASEARADVVCGGLSACGDPIPPFVVLVQSPDAAALGIVSIIGNGRAVARGKEGGAGWLAVGYLASTYNLTVGALWTSTALDLVKSGSVRAGWGTFQAILGGTNLAIGTVALGLTLKAQLQGKTGSSSEYAQFPPVLPGFTPIPGGGVLTLGGAL